MRWLLSTLLATCALGAAATPSMAETKTAIFAGGCFWCVEKDFEHVAGVIAAESGYTGGNSDNPTYKSHTAEGHLEAVRITYDSDKVTYDQLLHTFWRSVNPTDIGGQFCDRGNSYRTAIFAVDDEQLAAATVSKEALETSGKLPNPIVTPVVPASTFYPAEDYHQDYYKKNPVRYRFYRFSCGRDQQIQSLWGDEAHAGIDKKPTS